MKSQVVIQPRWDGMFLILLDGTEIDTAKTIEEANAKALVHAFAHGIVDFRPVSE